MECICVCGFTLVCLRVKNRGSGSVMRPPGRGSVEGYHVQVLGSMPSREQVCARASLWRGRQLEWDHHFHPEASQRLGL